MIRIASIADMHGILDFTIEPCDLLIIAGDIAPCSWMAPMVCIEQEHWIRDEFIPWAQKQPVREIVCIAGNHDWIWDIGSSMVPQLPEKIHYLQDSSIEIFGLKIYGTPQQKIFHDWAFNRSSAQLRKYYAEIPEGLDILISHTPPCKILDFVDFPNFKGHEGSKELRERLKDMLAPPKWVVSGHFHGQYGIVEDHNFPGVKFMNCSLVDEKYRRVKEPIYWEINNERL